MVESFAEKFARAHADGKTKKVSHAIHMWETDGEVLVGRILEVKPFEGGTFDAACNQYLMETDDGVVSFILGSATDDRGGGALKPGVLAMVSYHGKAQLRDGRSVNRFEIEAASAEESLTGTTASQPGKARPTHGSKPEGKASNGSPV